MQIGGWHGFATSVPDKLYFADSELSGVRFAMQSAGATSWRLAILHPFAPQLAFAIVVALLLVTYLVAGAAPSGTFETVAGISWAFLLAIWIVADARRRRCTPCFDFGLFCYLFLPIAVPWYCFWSRGWRGAFTLLTVFGLRIAPYIVASIIWLLLYG